MVPIFSNFSISLSIGRSQLSFGFVFGHHSGTRTNPCRSQFSSQFSWMMTGGTPMDVSQGPEEDRPIAILIHQAGCPQHVITGSLAVPRCCRS